MALHKASLALVLLLFVSSCQQNEAQLLANIKSFLSNVPTFGSKDVPNFTTDGQRVYVSVPAPSDVSFGTVDPQTGTWAYTDKSLGAGVEVGPNGASILSRNPIQGVDDFSQAARIGPDGVVIGPDKAPAQVDRGADQALGNFGIKNLKINPDGILINDGNRLNSSVTVNSQGIQLQGNPTGGGESHLFIKPNLRIGDEQVAGAAAPAKQPSNVQISVGDGKTTATEQLQGYTNYQLDPKKGTYTEVGGNTAPPFMGLDPNGKPYTSFARAPAPGPSASRVAASAAAATQQGLLPQNAAMGAGTAPSWAPAPVQAPAPRVQLVTDRPLPRQYAYGGDIVVNRDAAAAGPTPAVDLQPQATTAQWQSNTVAAPAVAPVQDVVWSNPWSDSSAGQEVMSFQQLDMMAPAVQPEADLEEGFLDYAQGPVSAEQLGSLDINSFKKKGNKSGNKRKPRSTTPLKKAKAPSKQANAAAGGVVNPAAQTAQQPAQSGNVMTLTQANPAAATTRTTTANSPTAAKPQAAANAATKATETVTAAKAPTAAAAVAAVYTPPTPQETAAIASRLKEVLAGNDAESIGDTSFQSGSGGGTGALPAAAQDSASAAEAAVRRASDAVAQLQQNAANLGRRLLRA